MHEFLTILIKSFRYIWNDISFEAEIAGASSTVNPSTNGLFIPHQLRPIIGVNTYKQVQQKLQQQPIGKPPTISQPPMMTVPPPAIPPPAFVPAFANNMHPEKSYNSEPTPIILSSAPKLYTNRRVTPAETPVPQVQFIRLI